MPALEIGVAEKKTPEWAYGFSSRPTVLEETAIMESFGTILLWGGLFFLMMRFGCGSHLFGRGKNGRSGHSSHGSNHGCCGAPSEKSQQPSVPSSGPVTRERLEDPVCGKPVSTDKARTSFIAGKVHYFCSRECREMFEAAPDTYATGVVSSPASSPTRALEHHR